MADERALPDLLPVPDCGIQQVRVFRPPAVGMLDEDCQPSLVEVRSKADLAGLGSDDLAA